jgi:hypothetical protein
MSGMEPEGVLHILALGGLAAILEPLPPLPRTAGLIL